LNQKHRIKNPEPSHVIFGDVSVCWRMAWSVRLKFIHCKVKGKVIPVLD
jgi:hypothetical protein